MYAIVVENEKELLEFAKEKGLKIVRLENKTTENSITPEKINSDSSRVQEFLFSLGIRPHIKGFRYLRYILENDIDSSHGQITKALYPTVAKAFNTTSSRVERAIRHAIETAIDEPEIIEMYEKLFGRFQYNPTNHQFIEGCKIYLQKNNIV